MSSHPIDNENDEALWGEKERLAALPYFDDARETSDDGVLLSDRIEYFCGADFQLISPFWPKFLRPAGYVLRVGGWYTNEGVPQTLNEGGFLVIEPYRVAIIQTLETLNLPSFLIGRWNVQVGRAYQGLLWVGGAQVDPGFRGRLCCPIYNLSTQPVELKFGAKLAAIDFVTTTPVQPTSKPFQWWHKKKLLFSEYPTTLTSGVAADMAAVKKQAQEHERQITGRIDAVESRQQQRFEVLQNRIDTFSTLTFTVVAVLFTGLGIIATRVQESYPIVDPIVLVSAAALFFALWALFKTDREPTTAGGRARAENWAARLSRPFAVALISTAILVAGTVLVLNHLRQPQDAAMPEIRRQVESLRSEVFLLQSEVAALRAQQSVSKPTAVNTEPKKNTATRNH